MRARRVERDQVSRARMERSLVQAWRTHASAGGVLRGRIDVDFHPQHKGEQRRSIESLAARVQVVGTRFSVQVDALGNTDVRVREGVVEVLPRSGAETQRVAAGGETFVRADDGDE